MLSELVKLDQQLFLFLNSQHNAFFDFIMYWASEKFFWIPFYAWLGWFGIKELKHNAIEMFVGVLILIILTDQVSAHLIKPLVHRLRPCHDDAISNLVHLTKAGCGGMYGFVSSHATNAFGLAMYVSLCLRQHKFMKFVLFSWAVLVGYSRVYAGVHYPGDVLCGALLGILTALIVYPFVEKYKGKVKRKRV